MAALIRGLTRKQTIMFTIVHPARTATGLFDPASVSHVHQIGDRLAFDRYLDQIAPAVGHVISERRKLLASKGVTADALKRMEEPPREEEPSATAPDTSPHRGVGGDRSAPPMTAGSSDSSITDGFHSTFYRYADYKGRSKTLDNLLESINADVNLSNDGLNDKVSSIRVGEFIICVVCFQHSWFRGKSLWRIAGMHPSVPDLSKIPFPGGGTWDNRISSVVVATLSPADVARWLL